MSPVGTTPRNDWIINCSPERYGSYSIDRAYATGPLTVPDGILLLHDTPGMKLFSKNLRPGLSVQNEVPADGEEAAQLVRLPRTPAPRACIGTPTPDRKEKGREFEPNQGPRVTGLSGTACGLLSLDQPMCQIDSRLHALVWWNKFMPAASHMPSICRLHAVAATARLERG